MAHFGIMAKSNPARRYLWTGVARNGTPLNGEIMASNDVRARVELRRRGITPVRVERPWRLPQRIPAKTITLVLRQMATLIHAGIPLLAALDTLAKTQSLSTVSRALLEMRNELQMGRSLAQSMQQHPSLFDRMTCTLVAAGEQAGLLDLMLERIASYREKMLAIRSKVHSAMAYPLAILAIAGIVTILMLTLVIPAFETTFSSFGAALPWPTRMLINLASTFQTYGLWLITLLTLGIVAVYHSWQQRPHWQTRTDGWLLRLPGIGKLLQQAALARWSQTLASLIGAGIPLLDALGPAGDSAGNRCFIAPTRQIQQLLQQGTSFSSSLSGHPVFSALTVQMVAVGEASGTLDDMLRKIADIYEREVNDTVSTLSNLMEPLMMLFLGLIIGGMVIAMYLPIFQLGNVL